MAHKIYWMSFIISLIKIHHKLAVCVYGTFQLETLTDLVAKVSLSTPSYVPAAGSDLPSEEFAVECQIGSNEGRLHLLPSL